MVNGTANASTIDGRTRMWRRTRRANSAWSSVSCTDRCYHPSVAAQRDIGIALLGLGNVGAGVVKLLADNAAAIAERLGARPVLRAIAVRAPDKKRLVE